MPTLPRIAILGAGYIGTATSQALAASGALVWAVRRTPSATGGGITWLAGDLAAGPLAGLPSALDAVLLTVAPSSMADGYERTYPPAARAAVALARETGARAVVYTSSTGVYGGRDGAWMDESSPRGGEGPGNRALADAEDVLLASGLAGATVLRVAGIYGPGRDPRGRFADTRRLPARGEYWVNLAHRDDIVAALVMSLEHRGAARVLNVADGRPALAADVARWLAASRGEDPSALVFGSDAERSRSNQRIANGALLATGWTPRYPSFREGFTTGL